MVRWKENKRGNLNFKSKKSVLESYLDSNSGHEMETNLPFKR